MDDELDPKALSRKTKPIPDFMTRSRLVLVSLLRKSLYFLDRFPLVNFYPM